MMTKGTTIQVRIDEQTKKRAMRVLGHLNLTMSEAIGIYLRQIVFHNGIPFELKIPNEITAGTLDKIEHGQDVYEADNVDELFKDLEA